MRFLCDMLHPEPKSIDDLLPQIGVHEKHSVRISFPQGCTFGIARAYLYDIHYAGRPYEEDIELASFEGCDWYERITNSLHSHCSTLNVKKRKKNTQLFILTELDSILLYPLAEVLLNVLVHGNKKDLTKSIELNYYLGEKGIALVVTDQGTGFPVAETIEKYERGEYYYHGLGKGFLALGEPWLHTYYNETGNQCIIVYDFSHKEAFKPRKRI